MIQSLAHVKVSLPSFFSQYTSGERVLEIDATTLNDVINTLIEKYGDRFKKRILESDGRLNRFINIYINGKNSRLLGGLTITLKDGDRIDILPAVAGG
ncbi:MAG: MoaD family protein [Nitrososphaerota archaeon]|nr:MoaD family protein [Nitrososphaerota archaeon]